MNIIITTFCNVCFHYYYLVFILMNVQIKISLLEVVIVLYLLIIFDFTTWEIYNFINLTFRIYVGSVSRFVWFLVIGFVRNIKVLIEFVQGFFFSLNRWFM